MTEPTHELLQPGREVDDFTLPTVRGDECSLYETLEDRRVFLVFYRGGWCPLCNLQLLRLSSSYEHFEEADIELLAISNEEIEKGRKVIKRIGPPYPLLQDFDGEVLRQFGLVVEQRDLFSVLVRKEGFAHPGVVLIGKDRVIEWSYRGKNYRDRPSPSQMLTAAEQTSTAAAAQTAG